MFSSGNASTRTTLAARPSPTVPPAAQAFEPLVKSVLRHRLIYNIFAYSAAFTLASRVFLPGEDDASLVIRLLRPSNWVTASFTWAVGVLPIIVLRKVYLTPNPSPVSSPSKTVAGAFAKESTRRSIATYITSALLLMSFNLLRSISDDGEDLRLSVFVRSRKHPYYLNGRLIFIILAQVWFAVSFGLRNIMLERFVFRWNKAVSSSNAPYMPKSLLKLLMTVTLFTLFTFALYNVAFGLTRLLVLPVLLRLPVVRSVLRPLAGHFVKGAWTLSLPLRHLSLEIHAFTLGVTTLANWEFAESLFDVYIPQHIRVASVTADPNVTLVSGITSTDLSFVHFAYSELRDVAVDESAPSAARRTALFSDQKFNPSLWSVLAREALLRLGNDYQTFLRRGKPAPAAPISAPAPAPKPSDPPSTPLLRQAIYKAPRQSPLSSVLDSFASDSELVKAADAVATEIETRAKDAPMPELFRSVSASSAAIRTSGAVVDAAKEPVKSSNVLFSRVKQECRGLLAKHSPSWSRAVAARWDEWWTRERINKVAEMSLPNRELDALVIKVLSGLVCASLTEDRYGVVQRDIPRIIEAFLSFLSALEEYQVQVNALYMPPTPEEVTQGNSKVLEEKERTRIEVARATDAIGVVADALKSGVADIVRTFGDKLVAFKFPPRIAKMLQSFVDYA
ncbi:hypothetical protein HYDPIDRAFT_97985 [Hydnomerulius pinastri MD-312]|uniref:Unplaced genomic scaffold scaffold_34, whole genome shotgun sequence n=1 Tax=Hydnomerulius pinastri MD-312 TaxID=994086 RepID=A0A0C9W3N8_9AGAM|nr:hypothetical protein HYDPIDRAFT_97985 [Hydnomerulius pinastri MD-312]